MTRATIRELLRRRLNEQTADNWDDSTLNTFIDLAYALVQKQIRKVDPEALLFWDQRNTVAGTNWYAKPSGTRGPIEVGIKLTSTATGYTELRRRPYHVAKDWTDSGTPVYCHVGEYIGIFPAPGVSVTNGLQMVHAPTDSLAADTDFPKMEQTLHYAVVLWAALIAKGESPEDDSKDANELARIIGDIPQDYGYKDLGQQPELTVDVSDARGRGATTLLSSPGIYSRG